MKRELIAKRSTSAPEMNGNSSPIWARIEWFLRSRAPKTAETYRGVLREWCRFLGGEFATEIAAKRLSAATDLVGAAYIQWLSGRPGERPRLGNIGRPIGNASKTLAQRARAEKKSGLEHQLSNATVSKKVAVLRRIYRVLIANGLTHLPNPFDGDRVRTPPAASGKKRPTEMVPFEKVKSVIAGVEGDSPKSIQDAAILACLFGGALRRGEVVNLILGDVRRTKAGTTFLYLRATKSGKDAPQALPKWAANRVLRQLRARVGMGAGPGDPLFCSFRGKGGASASSKGISGMGISKLFRRACVKAGLPPTLTPHSARATAITRLLASGLPHREVQEFSRHSTVRMVELYDKRRIGVDENAAKQLKY